MCEKCDKNYLRIISKPHLQTMIKTPVKFQKTWHKTVGQGTYYFSGDGSAEVRQYGMPNTMSPRREQKYDFTVWPNQKV